MNQPTPEEGLAFHVAVFARAPVAGAAKTRLIPLLGAEGAARAQHAMTLRTLQTACAAAPGSVSLWTAGDAAHAFFDACRTMFSLDVHPQPEGNLGTRMQHCLQTLLARHERVLLIGTDSPALTPHDLEQAAKAMRGGARMVFTPAEDGGYVLVGAQAGTGTAALAHVFSGIDWSTAHVMSQTRERLAENGWHSLSRSDAWDEGPGWAEMAACWDVDEPADYERACKAGLLPAIGKTA